MQNISSVVSRNKAASKHTYLTYAYFQKSRFSTRFPMIGFNRNTKCMCMYYFVENVQKATILTI